MQLLLWRHAEAEDGVPDLERRLTARGHKQARAVAGWLAPRLPKDCTVLCSPAARARETLAALDPPRLLIEPRIAPGASVAAVLDALSRHRAAPAVLVVGHQPWIGGTIATLLTRREQPWAVRKAALWWLGEDLPNNWSVVAVMDRDLAG